MSKYEKPVINEAELGKNPFLVGLEVPVNKVKSEDRYKQDGELWFKSDYEYDADPHCKIFVDKARRLATVELSPRTKDLLLWVMYEAKAGKDWLWINKDRYMEESSVSSLNTYRGAVKELIKFGFLNKTIVSDTYWLNPMYFFHGSRIKAFPDNIKIK